MEAETVIDVVDPQAMNASAAVVVDTGLVIVHLEEVEAVVVVAVVDTGGAEAGLLAADTAAVALVVTADPAPLRPRRERAETADPGLPPGRLPALPLPPRQSADPPAPSAMPPAAPLEKRMEMTRAPLPTIKRLSILFRLPRMTRH